jgi:lysozyme family protein
MAHFETAIEKTLKNEGFYSDNKNDSGGETYYGISRNNWPDWRGWIRIDAMKNKPDFPECLHLLSLESEVKMFYEVNFWDKIRGDEIKDQEIAESLFDFAVNTGINPAVKTAQKALCIEDDGIIGINTIKALNSIIPELFLLRFTIEKINKYIQICQKNQSQKTFFFGWVSRAVSSL